MISPHGPQAVSARKPEEQDSSLIPASIILFIVGVLIPGALAYSFSINNEYVVLAVVLGFIGGVLIMAVPHLGLAFFTGLLYIRPEESVAELAGMRLTLIVALIMVVAMWINVFMTKSQFARTPAIGLMIGFVITVSLTAMGHGNTAAAFEAAAKLLALVLLILNLLRTPERLQYFIDTLIVLSTYLAVYSIYLFLTGQTIWDPDHEQIRSLATGIFNDPNDLAATIDAGFALALVRIVQTRSVRKIFPIAASGIMLYAVTLTYSRGGLLALLAIGLCFFMAYTRFKTLAVGLSVIFAVLVLAVAPSRMTNFDSSDDSASDRFTFWYNGLTEEFKHPYQGIGYEGFADINDGRAAHNSFVLCFTENGYIGYFCWMGLLYYAYRKRTEAGAISCREIEQDPERAKLARHQLNAGRFALTGFLTAAFWLSRTYIPVLYIFICLPIVAQLVNSRDLDPQRLSSKERFGDFVLINLLSAGSIIFIYLLAAKMR